MFIPMVDATEANLAACGWAEAVGSYIADAGFWSVPNATYDVGADVLIAPMPATQGITDPDDPPIAERNAVLDRLDAGELTLKAAAAEPVFGNIKANRRFQRFARRGLSAARSEWRLICSAHNLVKLRAARLAAG